MLKDIKKCNKESNRVVHAIKKGSNHQEKSGYQASNGINPQIKFLVEELKSLKD